MSRPILSDPPWYDIPVVYGDDPFDAGQGSTLIRPIKGKFNRPIKEEEIIEFVEVSLEDLYKGITSKKVRVNVNRLCPSCKGKGSSCRPLEKCSGCGGSGIGGTDTVRVDLNKTMVTYGPCRKCNGFGETFSPGDHCIFCNGHRVYKTIITIPVDVEKGMQDGTKITLPGKGSGNEAFDSESGDIVFVLKQREHPIFKRKGNDLIVDHKLSLMEALTGFKFVLTHLNDDRKLLIKSNPGEVIKPEQVKAVVNEGMVIYQSKPLAKGKLYIHFHVEYPDDVTVTPDECLALQTYLPASFKYRNFLADFEVGEETRLESVSIEEVKAIQGQ